MLVLSLSLFACRCSGANLITLLAGIVCPCFRVCLLFAVCQGRRLNRAVYTCSLTAEQEHLTNARHSILIGIFLQGTLLNKEVSALTLSSITCEN